AVSSCNSSAADCSCNTDALFIPDMATPSGFHPSTRLSNYRSILALFDPRLRSSQFGHDVLMQHIFHFRQGPGHQTPVKHAVIVDQPTVNAAVFFEYTVVERNRQRR